MHDRRKSDGSVVPAKLPNKAVDAVAEAVEGRGPGKGNAAGETRPGRSAGLSVSSDLDRVRQVARKDKDARFTALLHHVTVDRLELAYRAIRPGAAPGGGRGDVEGLRARSRREPSGSARSGSQGRVPAEAVSQGVHPKARRAAEAARGRFAGGQDRPAGGGRGAERLGGGLRRFLLWVPAGALTA